LWFFVVVFGSGILVMTAGAVAAIVKASELQS
jgi:hypothetical protein